MKLIIAISDCQLHCVGKSYIGRVRMLCSSPEWPNEYMRGLCQGKLRHLGVFLIPPKLLSPPPVWCLSCNRASGIPPRGKKRGLRRYAWRSFLSFLNHSFAEEKTYTRSKKCSTRIVPCLPLVGTTLPASAWLASQSLDPSREGKGNVIRINQRGLRC